MNGCLDRRVDESTPWMCALVGLVSASPTLVSLLELTTDDALVCFLGLSNHVRVEPSDKGQWHRGRKAPRVTLRMVPWMVKAKELRSDHT